MEFFAGVATLFGMVWSYCSAACMQRCINATLSEMERQIESCPECKARNSENLNTATAQPQNGDNNQDISGCVTKPLQEVSGCKTPTKKNRSQSVTPRSRACSPENRSRSRSRPRTPNKVGPPKKVTSSRRSVSSSRECQEGSITTRSPTPKLGNKIVPPKQPKVKLRSNVRVAAKEDCNRNKSLKPPEIKRPLQQRTRNLKEKQPSSSGKCTGRRVCKPGKITGNPFFNFLREYRTKRCGQMQRLIVHDGAQLWNRMSFCERCKYAKCGIRPKNPK